MSSRRRGAAAPASAGTVEARRGTSLLAAPPVDSSNDVLVWDAAALSVAEMDIANKISSIAVAAVRQDSKVARVIDGLRDNAEFVGLLRELTDSINGLASLPTNPTLALALGALDPAVFTSKPISQMRGGGACPTHQDYVPAALGTASRSMSFIMLLQDTERVNGATYFFPGSRLKEVREPQVGGTAGGFGHGDGKLSRNNLDRDLEREFGRVVLSGARLSIFRAESGNWHGAYPNYGTALRSVIIWSYATSNLVYELDH